MNGMVRRRARQLRWRYLLRSRARSPSSTQTPCPPSRSAPPSSSRSSSSTHTGCLSRRSRRSPRSASPRPPSRSATPTTTALTFALALKLAVDGHVCGLLGGPAGHVVGVRRRPLGGLVSGYLVRRGYGRDSGHRGCSSSLAQTLASRQPISQTAWKFRNFSSGLSYNCLGGA